MIRKLKLFAVLAVISFALSACSLLPDRPDVDTPQERLGEAYALIGALARTTESNLEAGRITPDQAEQVADRLDQATELANSTGNLIAADEDPVSKLLELESLLSTIQADIKEMTDEQ